jgi:O-antigen/teichoic acid export membrane protein
VALYAISMLLVSAANFLIVPLLILALGNDGFSTWALLEPLALAAIPLAGFGIQFGLMHQGRSSSDALSKAFAQLWVPYFAIAGTWGITITALAMALGTPMILAVLVGAVVWSEGTLLIFITVFRAQNRPLSYAIMEGGRTVTVLVAMTSIVLASPLEATLSLYLMIRVGAALLALYIAFQLIRPTISISLSSVLLAVRYGAPIVVASMMVVLLTNFDRYALLWIGAEEVITKYTIHSKISQTLAIATSPFYMWFAPLVIRRIHLGKQAHLFFVNATSVALVLTVVAAGSLWLIGPLIWVWLFPSAQYSSPLFGVMILGAAAFALGNTFSIGSLAGGQTHYAFLVTGLSLSIGIAAALFIGQSMGPNGVAIGRAIGMLAYTALFAMFTITYLNINYAWSKYVILFAASISVAVSLNAAWPTVGIVAAAINVLIFVFIILSIAGFLWRLELVSIFDRARLER